MRDRTIKELFLLALCVLFFAGLGPFGVMRLLSQEWAMAALDLTMAALILGLFIYIYATGKIRTPQVVMAWIFLVGALLSSYFQGINQIYWSFPAIISTFFLLGSRHAMILCLLFFTANLAMLWGILPGVMLASVSLAMLTAILVSFTFALSVQRQHDKLQKLASIDPLTGVGNRRAQDEKLDMLVAMFQRNPFDCSVLLLDVDHFKAINDTHGHAVGDRVLVELTGLIRSSTRATETLYRYGGEEFVIIAEHNDQAAAAQLADRLRDIIQQRIYALDIRLTISIGVAQLKEKEDTGAWLKRADDALFRAKNEGRNRVVMAEPAESLRETELAALGTGAG